MAHLIKPSVVKFTKPEWVSSYSGRMKALYDMIYGCMEAGKKTGRKTIKIDSSYSYHEIRCMYLEVLFSNPLFYYVKGYEVKRISDGIRLRFTFYSNTEKEVVDQQIEEKVEAVYRTMDIDHCRSDLEVEKAVNDWLVKNGTWEDEDPGSKTYARRHNVLGILLDGKGVCLSFAQAASLLLNCFGIKSRVVTGRLKNEDRKKEFLGFKPNALIYQVERVDYGSCDNNQNVPTDMMRQNQSPKPYRIIINGYDYADEECLMKGLLTHAWNMVYVDGRERQIDVTFNAGAKSKPGMQGLHDYFNWTTPEILDERYIFFGPHNRKV